ncbi:putative nuclease HARBI1 [Leptopilina boulardi]|uniref:putative nuclease HARBI1 n=1 Tax=Leptopilina boulardi TaxID=63433 RepID=UPI0021F5CCBC|nr:putative nuclease HARBI1 [Leptopilina boulardi]
MVNPIAPPQPAPRNTVPNLHKIIKSWELKYPGKLDADAFLDEFERKLAASAINPDDALTTLPQAFSETAYTWFATFRTTWQTWAEFSAKFRKTFGDANDVQQINNKIQRAIQQENETGIEFVIRISALYNKLQEKVLEKNQLDKIYSALHSELILQFDRESFSSYEEEYYFTKYGFPGVVGAIDGSHIKIDKPAEDKDSYINRKQYFSIQMQGVVDENKKIIDICVGYPGSVHDARVLRESTISTKLRDTCGDNGYLLGDTAYLCLNHLMVPYKDRGNITRAQIKFNQKLSQCRVVVENAFGCLKQRFRLLYHMKVRNIVRLVQIVVACCVLHNLANANDLQLFEPPINDAYPEDEVNILPNVNIDEVILDDSEEGKAPRDELCRQFVIQN